MLVSNMPANLVCLSGIGGLQALAGPQSLALPTTTRSWDHAIIRAIGGTLWVTHNGVTPAVGTGRAYDEYTDYIISREDAERIQIVEETATNIYVEFYKVR